MKFMARLKALINPTAGLQAVDQVTTGYTAVQKAEASRTAKVIYLDGDIARDRVGEFTKDRSLMRIKGLSRLWLTGVKKYSHEKGLVPFVVVCDGNEETINIRESLAKYKLSLKDPAMLTDALAKAAEHGFEELEAEDLGVAIDLNYKDCDKGRDFTLKAGRVFEYMLWRIGEKPGQWEYILFGGLCFMMGCFVGGFIYIGVRDVIPTIVSWVR